MVIKGFHPRANKAIRWSIFDLQSVQFCKLYSTKLPNYLIRELVAPSRGSCKGERILSFFCLTTAVIRSTFVSFLNAEPNISSRSAEVRPYHQQFPAQSSPFEPSNAAAPFSWLAQKVAASLTSMLTTALTALSRPTHPRMGSSWHKECK